MTKTSKTPWGKMPDGREASLYTLENSNGMRVSISDFGGIIYKIELPDRNGGYTDVTLGHENFEAYLTNPGFFGALIGRNGNRIGNATVELDGVEYALEKNDGENNLHGGKNGLHGKLFGAWFAKSGPNPSLCLTTTIAHMEDGLPGNLRVDVIYTLTEDNTLQLDYEAVSDRTTLINLTNHAYFNLTGHASGSVDGQVLTLNAPFYCPGDATCMPTGELFSVKDTPFDFRRGKRFAEAFESDHPQLAQYNGFDHNFCLPGNEYRLCGGAICPASGRYMEFYTTLPAVQVYTANGIKAGSKGKDGAEYGPRQAFCLESQTNPNAAAMPWLKSPIYRAGEIYRETTAYRFGTQLPTEE
jgi:aldose 1-epimerase